MHVTWTTREWQAVEAALPREHAENPSPSMLDAAQKAALPPYRWRPRVSLYGRLNRAHYRGELTLARMRNEAAQHEADKVAVQKALEQQERILRHQQSIQAELEAIKQRLEEMPKPVLNIQVEEQSERAIRIDIIGLKGQQIDHVRKHLPEELVGRVRFIDTNALRRMRDPATHAVIFARFVSHSVQEIYRGSTTIVIYTRSANAALPAIDKLISGDTIDGH